MAQLMRCCGWEWVVDGVLLRMTRLIEPHCSCELRVWFDDKAGSVLLKVCSFFAQLQSFVSLVLI